MILSTIEGSKKIEADALKSRLMKRRASMKKRYDQNASVSSFNVGDFIMTKNTWLNDNDSQKFHSHFNALYRIIEF